MAVVTRLEWATLQDRLITMYKAIKVNQSSTWMCLLFDASNRKK